MLSITTYHFRQLYSPDSDGEKGTMKNEQEQIMRHNVHKDVKQNYDADKDFFLSFFHAYIVEAAIEFFGMDDRNSIPTKHVLPPNANNDEIATWVQEKLELFIDEMVFPAWSGRNVEQHRMQG